MKSKLILTCVMVAILLSLLGCSWGASVNVSCDEFYEQQHISKEVEVAAGDSFTVTLCSNPTTGFEWEPARISDQTVFQETDHEFVPSQAKGVEGAPGKEVWTFKALKKGTSTVSMEYSRPWAGGEKGAWTFVLTVIVK